MSGLPPPTVDDGNSSDVEFIGTSTNPRKRSIPEPQETPVFIKKRAIKVKPSIRKAEIGLKREDTAPSEISIKGIAPAQTSPADHTTQDTVQAETRTETEVQPPTRHASPPKAASPEIEIYVPPINPANIPRSALVPPRSAHPPLLPCRSVYEYTRLNRIEEGTYGIVSRARCNTTGGIYALKKLKLEEEKAGFPITSLREVMALMTTGAHENVVGVREIVVGDSLDQYALLSSRTSASSNILLRLSRIYIVMPFIEHDLKTLLDNMPNPFLQSEVKTLLSQLLSAVAHCHSNWIVSSHARFGLSQSC
jgi:cell division cycle 2-like protein